MTRLRIEHRVAMWAAGALATFVTAPAGCSSDPATTPTMMANPSDAGAGPALDAAIDSTTPPHLDGGNPNKLPVDDAGGDDEAADAPATLSTPDAAPGDDAAPSNDDDADIGPQVCGLSACPPGAPCPDLTVDRADLLASILIGQRTFLPTDCAVAEGCITTTGDRKLLQFDTGTVNSGTADLSIGDPTTNACFTWSQCHQHYHFRGVGLYTLYEPDGVTVAAVGHKQGFCLEDVEPDPELNPPPPEPATLYSCTNQGLHVGWEDIYPNNIDCQWIDITGVPSGQYILSVEVDAEHYLPESNYENNEERVPVTIP